MSTRITLFYDATTFDPNEKVITSGDDMIGKVNRNAGDGPVIVPVSDSLSPSAGPPSNEIAPEVTPGIRTLRHDWTGPVEKPFTHRQRI